MILMCVLGGCEEEKIHPEVSRQILLENGLSIQIEGGSFTQITQTSWGDRSRYEVEFSLESLKSGISVLSSGCESRLISFRARYHPQRYQILSRLYRSSAQQVDAESELSHRGLLREDDDLFEFASPVLELTGADRSQSANELMWSVLIHGDDQPVKLIMGEESLVTLLESSSVRRTQQDTRCVQQREISSYQLQNERYLIRHQIRYQWQAPFRLGVISRQQSPQQLARVLDAVAQEGLDGIVILGGLSNGMREELSEARQILSETPLFWWALPGREEVDIYSTWVAQVGPLDYAMDLNNLRLTFLDLSYTSLTENQSSLISRWVNSKPLVAQDEASPHTLALFSIIPLVNFTQRVQQGLSYRVGALRALSALRSAHLTHHIISGGQGSDLQGIQSRNTLGVNILTTTHQEHQILELKLYPQCLRADRGETCITWHQLTLDHFESQ